MPRNSQKGYYGEYGGRFVPETLVAALEQLERAFNDAKRDRQFRDEFKRLLRDFAGRPTPLYPATNLSERWGGAQILLKREDLAHTGAHKINNTIGQILLAKRIGKRRIVAETGAGQHGVATAAACAALGLKCVVYMGSTDIIRQAPNVQRMSYLGAELRPVATGLGTLKEAITEAIRDWVTNVEESHYVIGSVVGPHPYPLIVKYFQTVIGREVMTQMRRRNGGKPDHIVACVGGGSNAIGIFAPFIKSNGIKLIGVESAGKRLVVGEHSAPLTKGSAGILHGALTYILQDANGQILPTETISAGLDYPGVGPEHSFLKDSGRVSYVTATDKQAVAAFKELARYEGIIPALESSFALAYARRLAPQLAADQTIVVNLSGRGDKDLQSVREYEQETK
ncbi:MAG: tryptophan synthase subunit beta [bacterium]